MTYRMNRLAKMLIAACLLVSGRRKRWARAKRRANAYGIRISGTAGMP